MDYAEAAATVSTGVAALKALKDMLPKFQSSDDRALAEKLIKQAETGYKIELAKHAKDLMYPLCHRCFPPGIMVEIGDGSQYKCMECGSVISDNMEDIGHMNRDDF